MEVLVRNLDELTDLFLVVLHGLRWRFLGARYPALLACLLYSHTITQATPLSAIDAPVQAVVATDDSPTRDR